MIIKRLWYTPIGECFPEIPQDVIDKMRNIGIENASDRENYNYDNYKGRKRPDITDSDDPLINAYEKIAVDNFREFLFNLTLNPQSKEWPLEIRTFCQVYNKGERIKPHYHCHTDFIIGYYLDGVDDDVEGSLLLIDPRPNPQYPDQPPSIRIPATTGKMVFMPGYLMHETEWHLKDKPKIFIGCNVKILYPACKLFHVYK